MGVIKSTSSSSYSERAYTLVEVVLAAAITSVMFVSLYLGIAFGFRVTRVERENLRATQILLERMEGIRLFTFDQLSDPNLNPPAFTNTYYPQAGSGQSQGITYTGAMVIETNITMDPTASYSSDVKKVTVQLNWTSGGVSRFRSISTYAARNGIQNYIVSTNSN